MNSNNIRYSIIIPTYNEERYIKSLLKEIDMLRNNLIYSVEIIIVDGHSQDKTVIICSNFDAKIIRSSRGRGTQLRRGADIANGEILIFLHADLSLPKEMFQYLDKNFYGKYEIAVFRMRYNANNFLFSIYSFFTQFDSIFSTFGDQCLMITKNYYSLLGGFKDLPIMEDVEFFRRARRIGRIKKFNEFVTVSGRKFKARGIIKTQLISLILIIKYLLGVDPKILFKDYYREKCDEEKSGDYLCKVSRVRKGQNPLGFNDE